MDESTEAKIARLLREGLDDYGFGNTGKAILTWKAVLDLDPQNGEALDYIKTADRRSHPRPEKSERAQQAEAEAIAEAHRLIEARELDAALELLTSAERVNAFALEIEVTIELVRSCLVREYRQAVGDPGRIPTLAVDSKQITEYNLPSNAGFLISMMDGVTTLESLLSLSNMDMFEALRTTKNLIEAGIVRMEP